MNAPIDQALPDDSLNCQPLVQSPQTIYELLLNVPFSPRYSTLKRVSILYAEFSGQSADLTLLDDFFGIGRRDAFRQFLRSKRFTRGTIDQYIRRIGHLRKRAETLGWKKSNCVPEAWQRVLSLAPAVHCTRVAEHFAKIAASPADVTVVDVTNWEREKVTMKLKSYSAARSISLDFLKLLRDCGYTEHQQARLLRTRYGEPLHQLPAQLKAEVEALCRWQTKIGNDHDYDDEWNDKNEYRWGPPKSGKLNERTVYFLASHICRLYGFVKNIRGQQEGIDTMAKLVTLPILRTYVRWALKARKVESSSLYGILSTLFAAMRRCPPFDSIDLSWSSNFMSCLPRSCERGIGDRKARQYLPYSALETIPDQIRAERYQEVKGISRLESREKTRRGLERIARLSMEELLMRWLTILPWRNANIRNCRISGPLPNLFKERINPFSTIDKPVWVEEEEQRSPEMKFWQFRFSPEETKGRREIHCILPRQLIQPLEEFLRHHRAHMLQGNDPGTLFINTIGNQMTQKQVLDLVSAMTLRYAGTRVTPHVFRHCVALAWLKSHRGDYLTLSKILWHAEPAVTLSFYGARYNESCGVNAMDEWTFERKRMRA